MEFIAKKVKLLDDGFEIKFDRVNPAAPQIVIAEMQIKTNFFEDKSLQNAMFDISDEFEKICEVTPVNESKSFVLREIAIKEHKDKGMGVQLTAELGLAEHSDFITIKTPVLWEDSKEQKENMSSNLLQLVKEVQYEAEEFIKQERNEQINMFEEAS